MKQLPSDQQSTLDTLSSLEGWDWVDKQTRLVVMQFNLYNFHANMFAAVTIAWEFLETTGGLATITIDVIYLFWRIMS